MSKKVISERIVSSKIVSQNNAFADKLSKFGIKKPKIFDKFSNLGMSLKATCMAPFLLLIAFGVIFFSEKFERKSIVVENLQLEQAKECTATADMHKLQGKPNIIKKITAPSVGDVLYYDLIVEEYAEVEEIETETVTKVVDGQEVEQVIEKTVLVDKWKEVSSEEPKWSDFKLGKYLVDPDSASKKLNLSTKEYWLDMWGDYKLVENEKTPKIGDQRMMVNYLSASSDMIVIGEIKKNADGDLIISSGDTFIVSNKSDADLLAGMQATEKTTFWVTKVIAILLLVAGFRGFIAPLLALLDFIPLVGKAANFAATMISLIMSIAIVVLTSIIIRYWWILLILLAIFGGLIAFLIAKSKDKE